MIQNYQKKLFVGLLQAWRGVCDCILKRKDAYGHCKPSDHCSFTFFLYFDWMSPACRKSIAVFLKSLGISSKFDASIHFIIYQFHYGKSPQTMHNAKNFCKMIIFENYNITFSQILIKCSNVHSNFF